MKSLTILLLSTLPLIHACMEFTGTFPFSHTLPFQASIIDNGIPTCWISMSLNEHNLLQDSISFKHSQAHKSTSKKRSAERVISLTSQPAYNPLHSTQNPLPHPQPLIPINEQTPDLYTIPPLRLNPNDPQNSLSAPKMATPSWDDLPLWQPWDFTCLPGYKARANVGLRGFTYMAHGQEFFFVPDMKEDLKGERWVYALSLWCKGKDGKGKGGVGK